MNPSVIMRRINTVKAVRLAAHRNDTVLLKAWLTEACRCVHLVKAPLPESIGAADGPRASGLVNGEPCDFQHLEVYLPVTGSSQRLLMRIAHGLWCTSTKEYVVSSSRKDSRHLDGSEPSNRLQRRHQQHPDMEGSTVCHLRLR